jgi:alpha-mannosidase
MGDNILTLSPRMSGLIFHLIAHTHWDREWYLPRAAFQARLVPMVDDLLERLQADPGFKSFLLDGQTVLLEDYLRARPDRESDVRALVKTGRLQVGPWYVLADELIPSGESLLRNLLLGAADAERLGGRLDVLYSPDAFGHPAALPTLAREFGIKYGILWRGLGGGRGQDRDLYRWRGPDGREILVWHLPPQGYEIGAALPAGWEEVRAALLERAAAKHVPIFIGADHHAAHPHLVRLRQQLAEREPANAVRISRLDEFFQAVAEGVAAAPLTGELRWSYGYTWSLQGVHGTRAPAKRRHGAAELGLERFAEPLAALARRYGGRDRRPLLDLAWRTLVRAQFHDTLAGCTSDAVAAAAEGRLGQVEALAGEIARGALFELAGHDPDAVRDREGPGGLVLWNPAARARTGVVMADTTWFRRDEPVGPPGVAAARRGDGHRAFALRTPDGRLLPVQVLDRRVAQERRDAARHYPDQDEVDQVRVAFRVSSPAVPGLGAVVLTPAAAAALPSHDGVRVRGRTLENRFIEVSLEPSGALTVVDRRSGERYPDLLGLEDGGDAGDTYTYCPPARDRVVRSRGPITVRRLAAGPLVAALEARWSVTRGIGARLVVQLQADGPLVRCILDLDNRATWHRLRARLPTGLAEGKAVAGAAFGSVTRGAVAVDLGAFPAETPVRTAPAQRFVAAARGGRGLALFAPAFFEYEWTARGDLLLTLLRAVGELSRRDLPTRRGHAGWPTATPGAQCLGACRVELALAPVTEAQLDRGDALPELWEDAFLPVRGLWLRGAGALAPAPADVTLEGTGLVLSAVKPAQAGSPVVLRCYNATDRKAAGAWRFGDGVKSAHRVRADERESVALVLEQRGRTVRFVAEPHEIVTILVT